jgi:acyl-CoA synthetase (AMP-forming)/AMP-acid ligase II
MAWRSTLLVSGSTREHGVREMAISEEALTEDCLRPGTGRRLVASGVAMLHRRIEIVDPVSCRRLPEGEVGEIWVSGPDVASGYWNRADESERTFKARLADGDKDRFLRTRDLGAIYGGHLFVTGRLKDLIIIAGRNHYPQDIEATVEEADPAIRRGCCVAFGTEREGLEALVVVAEVRADACDRGIDLEKLGSVVRSAVAHDHQIAVGDIGLVLPNSVPKTSSGKLRRAACRLAFQAGELPAAVPHALGELA